MDTLLLGNLLARLHRDSLVNIDALLSGNITAHFVWFLSALLLRYLMTHLLGNINTHLVRNITADWEADLSLLGLGHIDTLFVRFLSAGPGYGNPDLVVALPLPPVLALFAVQSLTHRLNVGLNLSLELLRANLDKYI